MATHEYKARVQNKRATSAAWELNNPILLDGEMILVDMVDGGVKKKYGDGVSTYSELPFDAGESGVYLGSTEPTDESINVWIDTTGDSNNNSTESVKSIMVNGTTLVPDSSGNIDLGNIVTSIIFGGMYDNYGVVDLSCMPTSITLNGSPYSTDGYGNIDLGYTATSATE